MAGYGVYSGGTYNYMSRYDKVYPFKQVVDEVKVMLAKLKEKEDFTIEVREYEKIAYIIINKSETTEDYIYFKNFKVTGVIKEALVDIFSHIKWDRNKIVSICFYLGEELVKEIEPTDYFTKFMKVGYADTVRIRFHDKNAPEIR